MHCWPWIAGAIALLSAAPQDTRRFLSLARTFAIELPATWTQVTPAQLRELRPLLPVDVHTTRPREFYVVGPVQRWLADDYDGIHLVVHEQMNELSVDRQGVDRIVDHWQTVSGQEGLRHEVLSWEITQVGPDAHPAIVCERLTVSAAAVLRIKSLDAYIPSGGRQILLSFRAPEGSFSRYSSEFRAMLATVTMSRSARGSESLGSKLLFPAIVGAFVGLMLFALRRVRTA